MRGWGSALVRCFPWSSKGPVLLWSCSPTVFFAAERIGCGGRGAGARIRRDRRAACSRQYKRLCLSLSLSPSLPLSPPPPPPSLSLPPSYREPVCAACCSRPCTPQAVSPSRLAAPLPAASASFTRAAAAASRARTGPDPGPPGGRFPSWCGKPAAAAAPPTATSRPEDGPAPRTPAGSGPGRARQQGPPTRSAISWDGGRVRHCGRRRGRQGPYSGRPVRGRVMASVG
jgi:hypothetical protein